MHAFKRRCRHQAALLGHRKQGRAFDNEKRAKAFAAAKTGIAHGIKQASRARTLTRENEIFLNSVTVRGTRSGQLIASGAVTYRIVVPE